MTAPAPPHRPGRGRTDGGGVALELAILAVPVLLVLAVIMLGHRHSDAVDAVDLAAFDAARAASLSRTADEAHTRALDAIENALGGDNSACADWDSEIDLSGFTIPPGQPAMVAVTVTCTTSFADIPLAGSAGTEVSAQFLSPLDTWRART